MNAISLPGTSAVPKYLIADDEAERLDALRSLDILDTGPAESFDTVTRLASMALRVPIVLVALVDAERQWFKSKVGLDASETPRNISFCTHVVYEHKPLVVCDATKDSRFAANPLVTGPPHVRAYLGIPLYTRGRFPIGTLCSIDRQPRAFGAAEVALMSDYAKIVEVFLHAMEDLSARRQAEAALLLAHDSLQEQVALQTRELQESHDALVASNSKLAADSLTDYLTSLPNRRVFSRRSEQAARAFAASGSVYGLVLMDLDNFKLINDEYGHDVGDDVLRAMGVLLLREMRGSADLAARLGGEEFAVLCSGNLDEGSLRGLAERIRARIYKTTFETPKGLLRFTCSFGLSVSQPDDVDWKMLYGRADAALYAAKAAGRDRIVFGDAGSRGSTTRVKALVAEPHVPD